MSIQNPAKFILPYEHLDETSAKQTILYHSQEPVSSVISGCHGVVRFSLGGLIVGGSDFHGVNVTSRCTRFLFSRSKGIVLKAEVSFVPER